MPEVNFKHFENLSIISHVKQYGKLQKAKLDRVYNKLKYNVKRCEIHIKFYKTVYIL